MVEVHQGQRWDWVGKSGQRSEYEVEQMISHAQFVGAKLPTSGGYAWATMRWLNEEDKGHGHWEPA